jgi:hypothetical protein
VEGVLGLFVGFVKCGCVVTIFLSQEKDRLGC